jgi:hypothetical protein
VTHPIAPPTFALEWCRKLGASLDTLQPLRGGINNQVFRCRAGEHRFVLKGYAEHGADEHDRFKAEVAFLNYARAAAPAFVPEVLGSDEASRSLVLESLEGEGFKEGTHPSKEDIDRALSFMQHLNADLELAKQYVAGSAADGFLKLTEHLQNVEQRISKMSLEHLAANTKAKAGELIRRMSRRLERLQESTATMIAKGQSEDALGCRARCVSPSDFGFHNAIRTPNGIKFFDFEFAGWDDPTKAVADFDLQPRVPLNSREKVLKTALPEWGKSLEKRHDILFPILELKWACIILAVLNPDRYVQLTAHDDSQSSAFLIQAKLHLAESYLIKG